MLLRSSRIDLKKKRDVVGFKKYKLIKKKAKKAFRDVRAEVYKEVYEKL